MSPQTIAIAEIDASGRRRPVDPDTVAGYAAIAEERVSEGKTPLIQPIVIRHVDGGYKLTAGAHRLAALREIGRETIVVGEDAIIRDEDDDAALESELFENLADAGLTALDRSLFLYEAWKAFRAKRGETRGRKKKTEQLQNDGKEPEFGLFSSPRFTDAAAERVGMSKSAVKLAKQIAEALVEVDAVEEVRGTMLEDNLNELKQLIDLPPKHRRAAAAAIKRGEARRVAEARVAIGLEQPKNDDPQARFYTNAIDVWGKLDRLHRANFLDAIGVPKDVAKKIVGNEIRQGEDA